MEERVRKLIERGDQLFGKKRVVDSLWQSISDQFYPERGLFTVSRYPGDEFADHLVSSYPLMVRRDLGNQFSGMLRKDEWFSLTVKGGEPDHRGKAWLAWATKRMRNVMYGSRSGFIRATKEGDHDFAAYGQNVISCLYDREVRGTVYQCWHMRDVAWAEDKYGEVCEIHRRWKPTGQQLAQFFKPEQLAPEMVRQIQDYPHREFNVRHIVVPAGEYEDGYGRDPNQKTYVSIFVDCENQHAIEETELYHKVYIIPRWQTVSGSQYAHSPATIVGLPDARMIQDMNRILLDAGERAVDPPVIASKEAIRGDVALFAGGVTWVDGNYDERTGEALRPLLTDKSGIPLGMEMEMNVRQMLAECFYLNKLTLPPLQDATAYEVSQRVKEYIRQALPIFEPMEREYNGGLCNQSFDVLFRAGVFGTVADIPQSLLGAEVEFEFETPISQALEREKVGRFGEVSEILAAAAQLEPMALAEVNFSKSMRDAIEGAGGVEWLYDEETAAQNREQRQAMQAAQMAMAASA